MNMENFVGRIVKISGTDSWGRDFSRVGMVYAQREGLKGGSTVFSLINTNGTISDTVAVVHNDHTRVTATKIEPELRAALKEAYKAKLKLDAFKEKYSKELAAHVGSLNGALSFVKANSNELTSTEFIDAVVSLFQERYPSSGDYYHRGFEACSWSPTEVTVQQSQDVEKWASPEKFSFLYREYDNTIHMDYDSPAFKTFCNKNAPSVIPELAKCCTTDVSATLGDKQWLSAERTYTFRVKYGYTKKSVEEIKNRLFGVRSRQSSIDDKIAAAEKLKGSSTGRGGKTEIERDF